MYKRVKAIFENGTIKPLEKTNLQEHQKLAVIIEFPESVVLETSSMIKIDSRLVTELAESDDLLFDSQR